MPAKRRGRPPASEQDDTASRILDAALGLFARQGFAATTVRQVASAVGVTDGALYAHFAGKQAVYDALLSSMGPPSFVALGLDPAALAAEAPEVAIRRLVLALFDRWREPRARLFTSVLIREGTGAKGLGGLSTLIDAARDALRPPFEAWQRAGLVRADVSPEQLVWELISPLNVVRFLLLHVDMSAADLKKAKRLVEDHTRFFLTCVQTTGDSPRRGPHVRRAD